MIGLPPWSSWHREHSYPQGKSDPFGKLRASLEFVGKYNEKFANLRWVIEFKYYSNREFAKFKTTIEALQLQFEDTARINGYAEGLQQEFPRAHLERYVIYCIGNQGFRIFRVEG